MGVVGDGWGDDQSPVGGKKERVQPHRPGKRGTKRSLLTEGNGIPLAVAVEGANRHDMRMVESTLKALMIERPEATVRATITPRRGETTPRPYLPPWGYTAHIRTRGEEAAFKERIPGYRARRWVVERTHSWLNRFQRLLIRREKKVENYPAMLHFACAWITFRDAGVFG